MFLLLTLIAIVLALILVPLYRMQQRRKSEKKVAAVIPAAEAAKAAWQARPVTEAPPPAVPAPKEKVAPPAEPPKQLTAPSGHNAAYILDINNSNMAWNEAFYNTFGYTTDEHANTLEWWTTHIHPDDAMLVNTAMNRLIEPKIMEWDVAYRFRRGNQSFVRINDHVRVNRDDDGRALNITGTMTLLPERTPDVREPKM